jgi:sensor c-di-GMP phosphodiesterase-like protein
MNMNEENKDATVSESKIYLEEKEIAEVKLLDDKTPLGGAIYEVTFGNGFGKPKKITAKKYNAIITQEKSDATSARERLVKKIGADIYAVMMEYGLNFSEIDPTLNEVVRLINDAQNTAIDHLWGNSAYDRSILDVNRVLLEKYESTKKAIVETGDNGAASIGGTPDTEAKK